MGSHPRIKLGEAKQEFNGKKIGRYATDLDTGRIVYVTWKTLLEREESYPLAIRFYNRLRDDVEWIYVVDKDSDDVFRFHRSDYENAERVQYSGRLQYAPDAYTENHGRWIGMAGEILY